MNTKLTILIVEDNESQGNELKKNLVELAKKQGRQQDTLLVANRIDEAVALMKQHPVDAILLDYELKENTEYPNSDVKYAIDLINEFSEGKGLSEYRNRYLFIELISFYNEDRFSQLRQKVKDLGFEFGYCRKEVSNFALDTIYYQIVDYINKCPLPYPLAYLLSEINTSPKAEKFYKMLNFVEMSIKYFTIILVADIAHREVGTISKRLDFGGYTFGTWLTALKTLISLRKERSKECFVPEIKEIFSRPVLDQKTIFNFLDSVSPIITDKDSENNSTQTLELLGNFLNIRNELQGHILSTLQQSVRELLVEKMQPVFNQFKNILYFLYRYPLLIIERTQIDEGRRNTWLIHHGNDNNYKPWYKYDTNSLMSSVVPLNANSFLSQSILFDNKVYLMNWRGEFLDLHPFITFHPYPNLPKTREVFIIDITDNRAKTLKHRSISSNDSFFNIENFQELKKVLNLVNNKVTNAE